MATTEKPISLNIAAGLVPPSRGKKTHISTIIRWITHGSRGPDGAIKGPGGKLGAILKTIEDKAKEKEGAAAPAEGAAAPAVA